MRRLFPLPSLGSGLSLAFYGAIAAKIAIIAWWIGGWPGLTVDELIPLLLIFFVLALTTKTILIISIARTAKIKHRTSAGLCPACGYDLRASKDRCPECGREIEQQEPIVKHAS